jgi:hypothetical protein
MQLVLTEKAKKLMRLCEIEGYENADDLIQAVAIDTVCPAICMTEGCEYTAEMEPDQTEGYCEACGGSTMMSALVLAGFI